jgi:hypothetical protein
MDEFRVWFSTGLLHILDLNGYDHILYVVVLTVLFSIRQWKQLLVLTSAFTIGHCLTLAISTLNIIQIKQNIVEFLIPMTILVTCLVNLMERLLPNFRNAEGVKNYYLNYSLAMLFGLVHGLGFSYLLKSMLGKEASVVFPLLSFNLGLEFGQFIIVVMMLLFSVFLARFTKIQKHTEVIWVSLAAAGIAFALLVQRI